MDKFDERILLELKCDGKIANVTLAERIGLSASATLRRVQELERQGMFLTEPRWVSVLSHMCRSG